MILTWSENCVWTYITTQDGNSNADPALPEINATTNATFKIKDAIVCARCYFSNPRWY